MLCYRNVEIIPQWPIELYQTESNRLFTVKYGADIREAQSYAMAARYLGEAIMHALVCEGKINDAPASSAKGMGD